MRIEDICTHIVSYVTADTPLVEAAAKFKERHVGCLVVISINNIERMPIGILTDRDIVISVVAAGLSAENLCVGDIMTKPVYCCDGMQTVFDAVAIMREHGVSRLPVVNSRGVLAGIISADDIWPALAQQIGALSEVMMHENASEMLQQNQRFPG
jgi:CBS domain-containing protein